MNFENIDLTPSIKKTLNFYATQNVFPQTILIEGGEVSKRVELSRLIAKAVLCTGSEKPCGECNSCKKIKSFSHPDVKEYGDENEKVTFKVETCREIKHDVYIIPNDGDKKVYILKEAQNMNENAENALLKSFEEPPSYVYFISTCDSRSAMLDTILSRATVISLNDENELCFSKKTIEIAEDIVLSICEMNEILLLSKTARLEKDKEEFLCVLDCFSHIFMEAILKKNKVENSERFETCVDYLCEKLPLSRIFELSNIVKDLENSCKMNSNYNLTLTRMCYEFRKAINR
ncbi:MAG: hypothetical protein RR239_00350 [Oscillospiraceae bacterium]